MNQETIASLAQLVKEKQLSELTVEEKGCTVRFRKRVTPVVAPAPPSPAPLCQAQVSLDEDELDQNLVPITSEVVGLFHPSSQTGEPMVRPGDAIQSGQVVGFVESMSLHHEVKSTRDGTLVEIIANEREPVEYGQALMLLASEA